MSVRLGLDLSSGNLAVLAGLLGSCLDGIGSQAGHGGLVATVVSSVVSSVIATVVLVSALLSTLTSVVVIVVIVVVLAVSTTEPVLSPHQGRGLEMVDGSGFSDDGQTQEGRQCVLDQHGERRKRESGVVRVGSSRAVEEKKVLVPDRRESKGCRKERTTGVEKGANERKHTNTAHSKKKTKW